jgi:hypothetical protein
MVTRNFLAEWGGLVKKTAQKVKKMLSHRCLLILCFFVCFILWGLFCNHLFFVRESCDILDYGGKDCLAKYDLAYKTGRF